jgi:uncharacterized protein YbjT (DUF2867 family)
VLVAVAGGTGNAGRHTVDALTRLGHTVIILSRANAVDLSTGSGLDAALAGVEAVVDTTNFTAADADTARSLFGAATQHLLDAERRAGVRHHVLLSIVGIDRLQGNAHYAGKRAQEALIKESTVPYTIVRATQFHDFAAMVIGWLKREGTVTLPPVLLQPVSVKEVGSVLAETAAAAPRNGTIELAGPETVDFIDMARRTLAARGESLTIVPSWRAGIFGLDAAGEVFLPGPDARLGVITFDDWLHGK